ncbi:MAG: hypothetical protein WKG07_13760 [Hymenobacter sp.]
MNYLCYLFFRRWPRRVVGGLLLGVAAVATGWAQTTVSPGLHPTDAPAPLDVADIGHRLYSRIPAHDSLGLQRGRRMLLLVPVVGYSQQTNGVAEVALDLAFQRPAANVSTVVGAAEYTLKHQLIFTLASSIWRPNNTWDFVGDWRVMHYPQSTYGLGMFTSTTGGVVSMDYQYLRFYQSALRRVAPAWYVG